METTSSQSNVFIRWHFTHTQVRRPGNPHTSVRGASPPYDSTTQQLRRIADEKFKIEAESYLSFTICEENQSMYSQNPLLFWRDHGSNYPTLQLTASLFLEVSAGSVAVESLFSITGLLCNSYRSSLSPATLHKLTFLHDNLDFIIEQCSEAAA